MISINSVIKATPGGMHAASLTVSVIIKDKLVESNCKEIAKKGAIVVNEAIAPLFVLCKKQIPGLIDTTELFHSGESFSFSEFIGEEVTFFFFSEELAAIFEKNIVSDLENFLTTELKLYSVEIEK